MSPKQLLQLPKFGNGIGLHRVSALCKAILQSNWLKKVDPIRVVGTNGKGSTAVMIAAILQEMRYKSGRFTSPHLFKFNERFNINGTSISNEELNKAIHSFWKKKEQYEKRFPNDTLGAFEAISILGFHHFFEQQVGALVLEAGIGGRFDPTRVMHGSTVAFTSVDLEHTKLLGNSLEQIAFDKIDIAEAGATVISGPLPEEIESRLLAYSNIKKINLHFVNLFAKVSELEYHDTGSSFNLKIEEINFGKVHLSLAGTYQVSNALVAILTVKRWLEENHPRLDKLTFKDAVLHAFKHLKWPGRFEKIQHAPPTFIDIAHTPIALQQVKQTAQKVFSTAPVLILGLSEGRQAEAMFKPLLPLASAIIVTRAYNRPAPTSAIFNYVKQNIPKGVDILQIEPLERALDFGIHFAQQRSAPILITGSLFLAAESKAFFQGIDPQEISFF